MHTNDVHSHIDPFPADDKLYANLGGYAKRQALLKSVRAEGNETLYFECGDMFQGTPYFNLYDGKLEISLMNKMGVDAVCLGNHEFDNGLGMLCDRIREANFPFLAANLDFSKNEGKGLVEPYKIFDRCGRKIGVFGLLVKLDGLVIEKNHNGTVWSNPIDVAQQMADELRAKGCDLIVALTHIGHQASDNIDDIHLARQTRGIDLILGGHSHTFLPEPVYENNIDGKPVLINQCGFAGINVGRIDIDFMPNNEVAIAVAKNTIA